MILLHLLDLIISQVSREKAYLQHNSINVMLRLLMLYNMLNIYIVFFMR